MSDITTDDLARYDAAGVTREHWKIMFISGMGFFTDAYDLFIIGVAMHLIRAEWHPSPLAIGLVTSTALLASAVGAIWFGRIADMFGRKRIYGYEVLVLSAGAVASALAPNIWWLIFFRIILGIGIGGDYPVSSTLMSEFAGTAHRGMMVSLVFAMQAAGLIVGPLLAAGLLWSGLSHGLVWRLLLAFGAVPAMAVFQMRRNLAETPRFRLAIARRAETRVSFAEGFHALLRRRDLRRRLVGASAAWFLMDFAYYGNTVSSPMVLHAIAPSDTLLAQTLMQLAVFAVAAVPGYFVAAAMMDRMGRKPIQMMGFAMMAVSFLAMALTPGIEQLIYPFLLLYGVSYFFTEFGPNATTFVYPAELFPVESRTTGHGVASAAGKIGGFIGVFTFPLLMDWHGLFSAELGAAIASLLGLLVTVWMLPETKGRTLEELNPAV
ncbi:MAG TPA: MFS transporter [Rhodopila sp.]|nr:MFS transporter [Rhodopila sp.]